MVTTHAHRDRALVDTHAGKRINMWRDRMSTFMT